MMRLFPGLLPAALLGFGITQPADAQDGADYRVTYIEVAPSATEQTVDLLASYSQAGLDAPGNQLFLVLQRIGRTNHFAILETWDSAQSRAAYEDSTHGAQFRSALEPLLISPPDSRPHSDLFTAGGANVGPGGVFVVTHVDVFPPHTETAVGLLNTLVAASRGEAGNARFDVWSVTGHLNHMTMVETWESPEARDRHVTAPHTRAFRGSLTPMSGALYDERLYRAL